MTVKKPLAFGESDVSKRIKNVLRYRKPRLISAVMSALVLAVISLVYLTNASEYYSDAHWNTDEQRDQLAQQALQELYILTGYQVTECVYTTDGRSKLFFSQSCGGIHIAEKPEHLLVEFLNTETGEIEEIYNGPGEFMWVRL